MTEKISTGNIPEIIKEKHQEEVISEDKPQGGTASRVVSWNDDQGIQTVISLDDNHEVIAVQFNFSKSIPLDRWSLNELLMRMRNSPIPGVPRPAGPLGKSPC